MNVLVHQKGRVEHQRQNPRQLPSLLLLPKSGKRRPRQSQRTWQGKLREVEEGEEPEEPEESEEPEVEQEEVEPKGQKAYR